MIIHVSTIQGRIETAGGWAWPQARDRLRARARPGAVAGPLSGCRKAVPRGPGRHARGAAVRSQPASDCRSDRMDPGSAREAHTGRVRVRVTPGLRPAFSLRRPVTGAAPPVTRWSRGLPCRSRGGHEGCPAGHEVVTGAAPPVTRWSRGLPRRSRGGHGSCPTDHEVVTRAALSSLGGRPNLKAAAGDSECRGPRTQPLGATPRRHAAARWGRAATVRADALARRREGSSRVFGSEAWDSLGGGGAGERPGRGSRRQHGS